MEKVRLDILGLSPSQSQGGSSFAVILGEVGGRRRLPIIIGMFEAQAIAIEMEKIRPNRPMTHDLFKLFADQFHFSLQEVLISDIKEGVFIAKIIGNQNGVVVEVDARPSDAIAIALRFGINIYGLNHILDEAGIVLDNDDDEEEKPPVDAEGTSSKEDKLKRMDIKELKNRLTQALAEENYEQAATIRDEINRRN